MSSLYFKYGSMNCGKSADLIQTNYNYNERGQSTLVLTASIDNRFGVGTVTSRTGGSIESNIFSKEINLYQYIEETIKIRTGLSTGDSEKISCVLVDEAQFLTKQHVWELAKVTKLLKIPVICYGLRTDAFGDAFDGSAELLAIADHLDEKKTICRCGSKATMTLRFDENNLAMKSGSQVMIGGNGRYESVCLKHYIEKISS